MAILDVAKFILEKCGPMSAMKLQKLAYYSQAWQLVWEDEPLFPERIEAWANGPVSPALYEQHRGMFTVTSNDIDGDSTKLSDQQIESINKVIEFYGDKSAQWLSELTHIERPWLDARKGVAVGVRSNQEISLASMAEYYGSL